jgi:hypothetical protein
MLDDLIALDKYLNWKVFGGHWNQTISRNAGSKIGRALGTTTDVGTSLFHWVLLLGLGTLAVGGIAAFALKSDAKDR